MMEGSVRMMFYYASLDLTELHFCMQSLQSEVAVAKNVEGKTMVWWMSVKGVKAMII